jgi:hypothetical protein
MKSDKMAGAWRNGGEIERITAMPWKHLGDETS